jgi:hypothetical protein
LGGPLNELGGFRAEEPEASRIVHGTFSEYPFTQFRVSVVNGWRQLLLFSTGDGINKYSASDFVSTQIEKVFSPNVYHQYLNSKQIRGVLGFDTVNRIHLTVIIISFLSLIGFLIQAKRKNRIRHFYATIFVGVLVAANAFILGALAGPFARFQGRVIWLVPLLASCFVLHRRTDCESASNFDPLR